MKTGASFRNALAPKMWSGWTWLITTYLTGNLVASAIVARSRSPSVEVAAGIGDEHRHRAPTIKADCWRWRFHWLDVASSSRPRLM